MFSGKVTLTFFSLSVVYIMKKSEGLLFTAGQEWRMKETVCFLCRYRITFGLLNKLKTWRSRPGTIAAIYFHYKMWAAVGVLYKQLKYLVSSRVVTVRLLLPNFSIETKHRSHDAAVPFVWWVLSTTVTRNVGRSYLSPT